MRLSVLVVRNSKGWTLLYRKERGQVVMWTYEPCVAWAMGVALDRVDVDGAVGQWNLASLARGT